jgi:hypothetical protein
MPSISINELRRVIPTRHGTYTQPDVSLKYPQIGRLRLTIDSIEIVDRFGRKQVFRIRWARTYFGRPRPIIECTCTRRAIKLFSKFGTYACRKCHGAVYTSQRQDGKGRKRFKAAKLRLELGGLPNGNEPLPAKRKWAHRRRYQLLRSQVQALEAAIKPKRFRKPIDIRIFAYHLPS